MSKYLDYGLTASASTGGSGTGIRRSSGTSNLSGRDMTRNEKSYN